MPRRPTNRLLVEGKEDLFAIAQLMGAHVPWGDTPSAWPVLIDQLDGVENLLASDVIPTYLKSSEVRLLGVVIDANDEFESRWARIRHICERDFPNMPEDMPLEGLIVENADGLRLGVWIMPDNRSRGMLETFLSYLVPTQSPDLWNYARQTAREAVSRGAPYTAKHADKACIHTWLAWQDPPGPSLGLAVKQKCLDARSPSAVSFVRWFKTLYRLT